MHLHSKTADWNALMTRTVAALIFGISALLLVTLACATPHRVATVTLSR